MFKSFISFWKFVIFSSIFDTSLFISTRILLLCVKLIWPIKYFLSYFIYFIYSLALRTFNLSLVYVILIFLSSLCIGVWRFEIDTDSGPVFGYVLWCRSCTFHFYSDLLWPYCVLHNNLIQLDINILRITFLTTIEVQVCQSPDWNIWKEITLFMLLKVAWSQKWFSIWSSHQKRMKEITFDPNVKILLNLQWKS